MFRKSYAAALLACAGLFASAALAQTSTPFGATAGSGLNFCAYKPDGTNLAGCEVKYVWNGSTWVLEPTGAGAAAGAPRTVVAQDPSTAAGSAPCTSVVAINQTASADVYTSTAKVHVCSLVLFTATAQAISVVEGTGSICATGKAALVGGTTASSTVGLQFFAGQGIAPTAGVPFMQSKTTGDHICILQSGTGVVSGFISFSDS